MPRPRNPNQTDTLAGEWKFAGFRSPNYTQVPDEFFDILAPRLTEAELRVLLYIIRRTFGWKKKSDNISLKQMVEGITTRAGRVLDHGTGLSKPAVVRAVKSLKQHGIITAKARQSDERGFEPTTYSLKVDRVGGETTPLLTKLTSPSKPGEQALVNESNIQETVLQETPEQERDLTYLRKASPRLENPDQAVAAATQPQPAPKGFESIEAIVRQKRPRRVAPGYDEDRQRILAYVEDFARELNDQSSLRSSTSRAYNLYKRSGLSVEAFVGQMFEARSITKERTATIKTGTGGRKNKMAYFFGCLENKLEARGETVETDTKADRP